MSRWSQVRKIGGVPTLTLAAEALSLVADHVIYVNPRQLVRWQTRSPRIDCSPHFAHSLFSWANHQGREFSSTLGEKTMRKSRQPAYGVAALNWPEPIAPSMFLPNQALRSMVSRCTYIHAVTMPVVRVTQGAPVKARIIPHLIFCLPPALRFPLFHPLDYDRERPPEMVSTLDGREWHGSTRGLSPFAIPPSFVLLTPSYCGQSQAAVAS